MGKGKIGNSVLALSVLSRLLDIHMDLWNSQSLELGERSRQERTIFMQSAHG